MKKTFAKILCIALVVIMAVTCFAACGGSKNYAENNTTIKIGVSGPLTGAAAIYGTSVRNAAQLAVDEINAAGGFKGVMLELIPLDDKHDPANVAANYASMYENGMQISLGCVTTKPGLEFKELSKADNVFFLTPSASADNIPEYSNGYQMCFADSNQGSASAEYFNANYAGKKIGVFYKADDDYSKGIYNKFKATLDASKFSGALVEASFLGDASTFDSQIQLLKDCDVIFMPIYYTPASQFMSQAKTTVKANAIYYGCDGLDGIDAIEGFDINSIPQEVSYLSHFNSNATSGPAKELIDKYNARFDEKKEPLNQFGAAAYDCVYAIYEAMKVADENGKTVTATTHPSEVCDILTEVFNGDFTFRGVTGECKDGQKSYISWESNGYVNKVAIKYIVKEADAE